MLSPMQLSIYRVTIAAPPSGSAEVVEHVVATSVADAIKSFDTVIAVQLIGKATVTERATKQLSGVSA